MKRELPSAPTLHSHLQLAPSLTQPCLLLVPLLHPSPAPTPLSQGKVLSLDKAEHIRDLPWEPLLSWWFPNFCQVQSSVLAGVGGWWKDKGRGL